MPESRSRQIDSYLASEAPGHAITVLFNLRLLDRMRTWVGATGDSPIWGLLLGRVEESEIAKRRLVTVEDCEPVRGKELITRRISWWSNGKDPSLRPVGLATTVATGAAAHLNLLPVVLVIRRGPDLMAGFVFSDAEPVFFPFDRASLAARKYSILQGLSEPQPPKPERVVPRPKPQRKRPKRLVWIAAGTACALLLSAFGLWWAAEPPVRADNFALQVQQDGRVLRLTWDPAQAAIRAASAGTLTVSDGDAHQKMQLNRTQLAQGSALYVPLTTDVDFRLELRARGRQVAASVRVLQPKPSPMPVAKSAPLATKPIEPVQIADRIVKRDLPKPVSVAPKSESVVAKPIPVTPAATPAPRPPEPPPVVEPEKPAPAPPSHRPVPVAPVVTMEYRPAPENAVKRGLQKIPVIGLFHRRHANEADFTPAKPMRTIEPFEPPDVAHDLSGEHRIELEIAVDKHGRVTDVDSLSEGADQRLVHAAAGALYPAPFQPAQANGRSVASRLRVTVHFRNPGGTKP